MYVCFLKKEEEEKKKKKKKPSVQKRSVWLSFPNFCIFEKHPNQHANDEKTC